MEILFILHEAHQTGATLALLENIKWYHKNTDISMSFLIIENGVLNNEFSLYGNLYLLSNHKSNNHSIFKKVASRIIQPIHEKVLFFYLKKKNFDLIYANTILCSAIIKKMSHFNCKMIWHIHELELAINCLGKHHLNASKYVDNIIANSKSTLTNLVKNGIDTNIIKVFYPSINTSEIKISSQQFQLRESLGLPSDAFIIGSSGSGVERKGMQSFLHLPLIINQLFPNNNFYYLWTGKLFNNDIIEYDVEKSGLKGRMIFTGEQKNPFPYYNVFDIFISVSKEESFGLSAIESATLHKPLVCFNNTGGIEEVVAQAQNITVPYLDIFEMAVKIIDLYKNADDRKRLGDLAYQTALNFDNKIIMPQMYDYLRNIK